ncbi:hypothetical protein HK102_000825 [Quaeritorhiza haematococci]|nr:hypothetical protein HK102_000825 [Quaeritorhiza haematococci]
MGKKKAAKNKAKDQAKAQKKAMKANKKKKDDHEEETEDIDKILREIMQEQAEKYKVAEESGAAPPSRRVNASWLTNPLNPNELLLFGG